MKPSDVSQPGGAGQHAGAYVHTERAAHLTDAYERTVSRCRRALLTDGGPHHVAYYSAGVFDFSVDVLDAPALAAQLPANMERRHYADVGRRLSFKVTSLDRTLEEVRTGRLIRTVLHTQSGVVVCNSVTPGGYVIALAFGAEAASDGPLARIQMVRESDMAIAELTTDLRRDLSLGPQDPGGWGAHHMDSGWLTERPEAGPLETTTPMLPPGALVPHRQGTGDDGIIASCQSFLSPDEVIYIAYYEDQGPSFSLDLLGHPLARHYFMHIAPEARRKFYGQFGREFAFLGRRLRQLTRSVFPGRLLRVVLDVEQGAIYYYRLDSSRYLVGVTLNQSRVSHSDDRLSRLAADLSQ